MNGIESACADLVEPNLQTLRIQSDIHRYIGQTRDHQVHRRGDSSLQTSFVLDDVTLTVQ